MIVCDPRGELLFPSFLSFDPHFLSASIIISPPLSKDSHHLISQTSLPVCLGPQPVKNSCPFSFLCKSRSARLVSAANVQRRGNDLLLQKTAALAARARLLLSS